MKRMLINATQEEELRMAMVDGQSLYDLNIELPEGERKKANIYKGKITRIEPSLEAAFVDYGADRHGFLPLKEISSEYFVKKVESGKANIRDVLKEGQDIVVQIDKEERGNKGAALTTFVSLAGRFIVLKPNKSQSGGVSRRIVGEDRDLARKSMNDVVVPDGMSVILRTAGIDRSAEELAWDLEQLMTIWTAILNMVLEKKSPFLIYRENNSVTRALRDYLSSDLGEILIDDEATYKEAVEFVDQVMPQNLKKLKHYVDPVPLFTRYQIESQIESAFTHSVTLPSGGSIVIDHTEALVSIDINSARATKGSDIEATALNTNLEAADEVARQLRIRDLGGLIVIDFIDMGPQKNQRAVENQLRDAVHQDRARVQIGKISRFGLLEMSRQRLRPSLGESSYLTCPRCSGIGTIRSVESLALAILRIIGEEARKERTAKVIAQLPVEVATYLLNEKRDWVQSLESRNEMQVVLIANSQLETPHYDVRRVRDDQADLPENTGSSYELVDANAEPETPQEILKRKGIEPAAIAVMKPTTPAPKPQAKPKEKGKGFWAWLGGLFGSDSSEKKPASRQSSRNQSSRDSRSRGGQRNRGRNDGNRGDNRRNDENRNQNRKRSKKTGKKTGSRNQNRPNKDAAKQQQQPKDDAQQKDTAPQNDNAQQKVDEAKGGENKPTRSRRSRGGRRRRRGGAQDKQATETTNSVETSSAPVSEQAAQEQFAKQQMAKESSDAKSEIPADKPKTDVGDTHPNIPTDKIEKEPKQQDVKSETSSDNSKEVTPKPKPKPRPKPKPKSESKPEPESKSESMPEAKPESKPEPKPELKPELKPESKPEPKPEPKPELKPESKPEPKPMPKVEPAAAPKAAESKPAEPKPEGSLLPWDKD
jgi:ribonuclease E